MKLVGGDSGRYEREEYVESVLLSPSERAMVDVLFALSGTAVLEHRTPHHAATLATFTVVDDAASPSFVDAYRVLRTDPELQVERVGLAAHLDRSPDKTLQFIGEMDMSGMDMGAMDMGGDGLGPTGMSEGSMDDTRAMPGPDMHRMQYQSDPAGMHGHEMGGEGAHSMHEAEAGDGIEWEDTMPEMNVMSNLSNMVWKILDTATGATNEEISWALHVGGRLKIRLDNSAGSDHQMHHPFHVHGAGRFLVLDRGGVPEANLVWKDTVLVRPGRSSTSCSTSPTRAGEWRTATSPSTSRAE